MCVTIFFTIFVWNVCHFNNWETYEQKCILVFMQIARYSRHILIELDIISTDFRKISNFMKIRPVGIKLYNADGRTDG
jgi:hypothetical protein